MSTMTTIRLSTIAKELLAVMVIHTCGGFLMNTGDTITSLCFPKDQFCSCTYIPEDTYSVGSIDWLEVTCFAQNLTKFPNYAKISDQLIGHYKNWLINLTDNELATVPTGMFSNFNSANTRETMMFLSFERNKISLIENGAFIGVNNMDISINLTDNRITALPLVFQMLTHLTTLSLQGNPILAFDYATVNSLASSLSYLEIGYQALLSGNKELSVLNITEMIIYDIPFDYGNLTFNPFMFFRNTMIGMSVAGTDSSTLPCILIDGPNMEYFSLQDATNISAISVFDCQPGTSLKEFDLKIMFSGLEEFPDILKFTPSLRALNLFHNKISSVNEKFIPLHNKLEVLNLSYNRLRIIPTVFRRFDNLKFLYIDYNQITFVAPDSNILSVKSLCAIGNQWKHDGLYCNDMYNSQHYYIHNNTSITPNPPSL